MWRLRTTEGGWADLEPLLGGDGLITHTHTYLLVPLAVVGALLRLEEADLSTVLGRLHQGQGRPDGGVTGVDKHHHLGGGGVDTQLSGGVCGGVCGTATLLHMCTAGVVVVEIISTVITAMSPDGALTPCV